MKCPIRICPRLLLFNIYLNDLISEMVDVHNYKHDTSDLNSLLRGLEHGASLAVEWFKYNYLKLNEH